MPFDGVYILKNGSTFPAPYLMHIYKQVDRQSKREARSQIRRRNKEVGVHKKRRRRERQGRGRRRGGTVASMRGRGVEERLGTAQEEREKDVGNREKKRKRGR